MKRCALLVDFGGTLDADGQPWLDRFFALYRASGGAGSAGAFAAAFTAADRALLDVPGIERMTYTETVAAQVELLAAMLPDAARLRPARVQERFVDDARQVAARNRPVLQELAGQFRLGVVSNYQGNLQPCLNELGLGDLFAAVSDSRVVGIRKPERGIFDHTLATLGCEAQGAWMVGDNPHSDIAAASALGMSTCWIAPAGRDDGPVAPTIRAARFDLLPQLLSPLCTA